MARENPDPVKNANVLHVRALEISARKIATRVGKGLYFSKKQRCEHDEYSYASLRGNDSIRCPGYTNEAR